MERYPLRAPVAIFARKGHEWRASGKLVAVVRHTSRSRCARPPSPCPALRAVAEPRHLRRRRLRALLHSAPSRAPSLLLSVEGGWGWCRRLPVPPGARTVPPLPALPSVRPARGRGVEVQPGPATTADTSSEATLVDPDRWRAYLVGRPRRPDRADAVLRRDPRAAGRAAGRLVGAGSPSRPRAVAEPLRQPAASSTC